MKSIKLVVLAMALVGVALATLGYLYHEGYFDKWSDKKAEFAKIISDDLKAKGAPDKYAEDMGMCQATKLVTIAEAGNCPLRPSTPAMQLLQACVMTHPELLMGLFTVVECLDEVKLEGGQQ